MLATSVLHCPCSVLSQLSPRQSCRHSYWRSPLRWPTSPHCQHTGRLVLQCLVRSKHGPLGTAALTTHSLAGWWFSCCLRSLQLHGLAEGLIENPVTTHITSWSFTYSTNAEAASLWPWYWDSPTRAQWFNCLMAAANSLLTWVLALNWKPYAAASWRSLQRLSNTSTMSLYVASVGSLCRCKWPATAGEW